MKRIAALRKLLEEAEKEEYRRAVVRTEQIRLVRAAHRRSLSQREIARELGMSQSTVCRLLREEPWEFFGESHGIGQSEDSEVSRS